MLSSLVLRVGNKINEGMVKPISSLELDGETLAPKKSLAVLAVTQELVKLGAPGTNELFNSELRTAVAAATDAEFLSTLVRGHHADRERGHND